MGTVSQSTIFSNTFQTIFDLLEENLTDTGSSSNRTKWIYSAYPDKDFDEKNDYPIVVVDPATITADPLTLSDVNEIQINVPIYIYSTSNSELDTISDDVMDELEKGIATLEMNKMFNKRIISTFTDTVFRGDIKLHMRVISFRFTFHHD